MTKEGFKIERFAILKEYFESVGFKAIGEEFIEANIIHIEMEKFY